MYIKLNEVVLDRDIDGPIPGLTGKSLYLDDVSGTIHNDDGSIYENKDPRFYTYKDPEPQASAPFSLAPVAPEGITVNERIMEIEAELEVLKAVPVEDADMLLSDLQ